MAKDHPGRPHVIYSINVFMKEPLTDDQHREIALMFRSYGALAVDLEGFGGSDPRFREAIDRALKATKSGEAMSFDKPN